MKKIPAHKHRLGSIFIAFLVFASFFLITCGASFEYKIIDVHEHMQNTRKSWALSKADLDTGVEKTILVASPYETLSLNGKKSFTKYRENAEEINKMVKRSPEKFVLFCTVNPLDADALEYLKGCIKNGGSGIKLYNGHSYYYDVFGIPLDSEKMLPIYAYAEENKLPVLFHTNIGNYQAELESVLEAYPDMVVNIPHFMVSSINLDKVGAMFDKYPNLYTDISFGSPEFFAAGFRRISSDPQKYADFINKYPDRVLFGTDMVITDISWKNSQFMTDTIQCYKNILTEKQFTCAPVNDHYRSELAKSIEAYEKCAPKSGQFCISKKTKVDSFTRWTDETKLLNGLELKSDVLNKVFRENAIRFLSGNK